MTTQNALLNDTAAVAVFANHDFADAAVKQLASSGFDVKKVTVIGRGFHTEDNVTGFYTTGDRMKFWGKYGAFWGGIWGLLFGGVFLTIPVIGPLLVVGHLAAVVAAGVEGALVVGGLSAFGAALYSIGIPKDSVLHYEKAIKADEFLVIVHGTPQEVERAHDILQKAGPSQLNVHNNITAD